MLHFLSSHGGIPGFVSFPIRREMTREPEQKPALALGCTFHEKVVMQDTALFYVCRKFTSVDSQALIRGLHRQSNDLRCLCSLQHF